MSRNVADGDIDIARRYPGFRSFKTPVPIHYPKRWLRSALIQSTLWDSTTALLPNDTSIEHIPYPAEFSFREITIAGELVVLVTQHSPAVLRHLRIPANARVLTRNDLNLEPKASTANHIWSRKRIEVPPADRYRAIDRVSQDGGYSPLRRVLEVLEGGQDVAVDKALSMLANGILQIGLMTTFSPNTMMSLGPLAQPPAMSPAAGPEAQWQRLVLTGGCRNG